MKIITRHSSKTFMGNKEKRGTSYGEIIRKKNMQGLATLVDKYKDRFKKMVLWDPDKEWTWCLAQMICAQQKRDSGY